MVMMMLLGLLVHLNIEFLGFLARKRATWHFLSDLLTFLTVFTSIVGLVGTAHVLEQWIRFREGETVKASVDLARRSKDTLQILKEKKAEEAEGESEGEAEEEV